MTTANLASILGLSLLAAALIAVFFSPYRRWLNFDCTSSRKGLNGLKI